MQSFNKRHTLLWLIVVASACLIVHSRYQYRMLTSNIDLENKQKQTLLQEKERIDYAYHLYTNPKYISDKAQKLGMIENHLYTTTVELDKR